jgi:hypothetical protein
LIAGRTSAPMAHRPETVMRRRPRSTRDARRCGGAATCLQPRAQAVSHPIGARWPCLCCRPGVPSRRGPAVRARLGGRRDGGAR